MDNEQQSPQDQLVGGLAHRMNNIFTLFHGYVGMMLENDKLDQGTRLNLGKIRDGASAASQLMDRTHSLVRPTKLVYRELDIRFYVELLKPVFQTFCAPNTKLEMTLPRKAKLIWTDAARVKTALVELVRNACEAHEETGGTVLVEVKCEPPPEGAGARTGEEMKDLVEWISIAVIDDGLGISPETAARMFNPFYSTRKQKQASGLGLNVAANAVQQLGGILSHSSRPGETRFAILLPMQAELGRALPQLSKAPALQL